MKCFFHKENDSLAVCLGCGNFICAECNVVVDEKHYCKSCVQRGIPLKKRRLRRSKAEKQLAGICAGVAHYFDIDPGIVRVIFILLCIFTGIVPLLLVYGILMFVLPEE